MKMFANVMHRPMEQGKEAGMGHQQPLV